MGSLAYGYASEIEIDDRTLAHLQIVLLSRLRRHESCSLSWNVAAPGAGRETIWISDAIPLRFRYDPEQAGPVNRAWIDELNLAASRGELRITPEPGT